MFDDSGTAQIDLTLTDLPEVDLDGQQLETQAQQSASKLTVELKIVQIQ